MAELARRTTTSPATTPPWEIPAPLLAMLEFHVRHAGLLTKTIGLQLVDNGRAGHIQVDVAEARKYLAERDRST